jgi:hypothetical protein
MIGVVALASLGAVMWVGLIYVIVVEPVRLRLRERKLRRILHERRFGRVRTPAFRGIRALPH